MEIIGPMVDGNEPGWFFLDAVDELKLTNGRLERALRRFSRDITGHLGRARVFVSSRPGDWRPCLDVTTLQSWLPVQDEVAEVVALEAEQVFMAAIQRESAEPVQFRHRQQSEPRENAIRTVAMLPMKSDQITAFAKHRGINDVGAFLEERAGERMGLCPPSAGPGRLGCALEEVGASRNPGGTTRNGRHDKAEGRSRSAGPQCAQRRGCRDAVLRAGGAPCGVASGWP